MKEETKPKQTKRKKATKAKPKEPKKDYFVSDKDYDTLMKYHKQLTRVRTSAVVRDLDAGTINLLHQVYKKYYPMDKGGLLMGCQNCTYKTLLKIAKLLLKAQNERK